MSRRPHEPDEPARLPSKKPDAIGMRPPSLTDVHDESATGVDKKTATRELAEVKARTMYRMVFDTGKQKVLYMSNLQAALVADDDASLGKMLSDGFEIPEPRCVINLLPGTLEIGLKELRSAALSHIDRFMADVLLPLAQQNNAVILVSAFPNMCSLSASLTRMASVCKARWDGGQRPFTIISCGIHISHCYENPSVEGSEWWDVANKVPAWRDRLQHLLAYASGVNAQRTDDGKYLSWLEQWDLDPYATHLLIVDAIADIESTADQSFEELGRQLGSFPACTGSKGIYVHLMTQMLRYLADRVPAISLKTGISGKEQMIASTLATGMSGAIDSVEAGIPLLLLDVFERPEPPPQLTPAEPGPDGGDARRAALIAWARTACMAPGKSATEEPLLPPPPPPLVELRRPARDEGEAVEGEEGEEANAAQPPADAADEHAEQLALLDASALAEKKQPDTNVLNDVSLVAWLHCVLFGDGHARRVTGRQGTERGAKPELLYQAIRRAEQGLSKEGPAGVPPATPQQVQQVADWLPELVLQPREKERDEKAASTGATTGRGVESTLAFAYRTRLRMLLGSRKCHGVSLLAESKDLDGYVRMLCRSDRLPIENSLQGLRLLRRAWDEHDVATHLAQRYKLWAKALFCLNLLLGLAILVLSAIAPDVCDDGDAAAVAEISELSPDETRTATSCRLVELVFVLSVVASFVISFDGYMDAQAKWRQLRAAAGTLQSMIWCYRGRVAPFDLGGAANLESEQPERAFNGVLTTWRQELIGSQLSATTFKRKHQPRVYRHFQREEAGGGGRKNARSASEQGRKNARSASEKGHAIDDHFSPVRPHEYIELRLTPALRFYQGRIPSKNWQRYVFKLMLLLATVAAALLSRYGETTYVTVVMACSGTVATLSEFQDATRKLERYSRAIGAIENLLTWWDSINPIEQASRANVSYLLREGEAIIANERLAWISTAMKPKAGAQAEEDEAVDEVAVSNKRAAGTKVNPARVRV